MTSPATCHSAPLGQSSTVTRGPKAFRTRILHAGTRLDLSYTSPIGDQGIPIVGCDVTALFMESGVYF